MIKRLKVRYWIWFALPFLIVLALKAVPFGQIFANLSRLRAWQVGLILLLNVGINMLFSLRWWYLLRSSGYRIPYFSLVAYRLSAFGISYFTPGPQFGGEPLQVYWTSQNHRLPVADAIATVTLDKLLEVLGNFTFLILGMLVLVTRQGIPGYTILLLCLSLGLFTLPILYFYFSRRGIKPITFLISKLSAYQYRSPFLAKLFQAIQEAENLVAGFCQTKPAILLKAASFSGLTWALMIGEYWLSMRFLGWPINLTQVVAALAAARLAFLLPLPGGIGALEASQVLVAQFLGIPVVYGASMAILIRARDITFAGIGLLMGSSTLFWPFRRKTLPQPARE